jgi:cytochrome P450 family 4
VKRRHAMLDTLFCIEDNGDIDADGIMDEVRTFIFAGYDTSSTGLTFIFMLIAADDEVQDRIFQEVTDVLDGRSFDELKIQDYNNMKYMERVIKEGLRLYPPASFISRTILEDIQTGEFHKNM